jgi:hypothetical protein
MAVIGNTICGHGRSLLSHCHYIEQIFSSQGKIAPMQYQGLQIFVQFVHGLHSLTPGSRGTQFSRVI